LSKEFLNSRAKGNLQAMGHTGPFEQSQGTDRSFTTWKSTSSLKIWHYSAICPIFSLRIMLKFFYI